MKVQMLIDKLKKIDPEHEVVLPVSLTKKTNERAVIGIDRVSFGFDWESKEVMIHPTQHIVALSEKQYEYFYSEFLKSEEIRKDAIRNGITDIELIEKDMNPLFRTYGDEKQ